MAYTVLFSSRFLTTNSQGTVGSGQSGRHREDVDDSGDRCARFREDQVVHRVRARELSESGDSGGRQM